jgi:NAD(P)-dependent dehydrogenase (short-subunit alcohol dehydrogenase family)
VRSELNLRLAGKVAIITGAAVGIGEASALLFADEGAAVVCVDIDQLGAEDTAAAIRAAGGKAIAITADVRRASDTAQMVNAAIDEFGHLDVLFNNAGTAVHGQLHEFDEAQWDLDMDTNLKGVYLGCKAALPVFLKQGAGNIISTASTLGLLAFPGFPAFSAAKAGVINLTKTLALEYGPAIRVNCVCPGATDTPVIRRAIQRWDDPVEGERVVASINRVMRRLATPREIANAALFLASDESSFVTGHTLVVDGGQTIDA